MALNNYELLLTLYRIDGNRIIIRRISLIRFHQIQKKPRIDLSILLNSTYVYDLFHQNRGVHLLHCT